MLNHDGMTIPKDPYQWDVDAIEWTSMVWDADVACYGDILTSEWIIPATWTSLEVREDVPINDCDGSSYQHGNQIRLSTVDTEGSFTITNRVTFQDGTSLDRSVIYKIKPT